MPIKTYKNNLDAFLLFSAPIISFIISILLIVYIWNSTIPNVFRFNKITFAQALGLIVLSNIFFGTTYHNIFNWIYEPE
jgi:hypothetical protein